MKSKKKSDCIIIITYLVKRKYNKINHFDLLHICVKLNFITLGDTQLIEICHHYYKLNIEFIYTYILYSFRKYLVVSLKVFVKENLYFLVSFCCGFIYISFSFH